MATGRGRSSRLQIFGQKTAGPKHVAVEPSKDPVAVLRYGASCLLYRIEPGADRPSVPAFEKPGAPFPGGLIVDLLEGKADPIGTCGFQMQPRQSGELGAALGRQ